MSVQLYPSTDDIEEVREVPAPRGDVRRERVEVQSSAGHVRGLGGALGVDNESYTPTSPRATTSASVVVINTSEAPRRLPRIRGRTMILRTRETFHNRWPFSIGVAEIGFGFLTLALGILEIMVLPLMMDPDPDVRFEFKKQNCFGVGIWTGAMLILTGSLAVRASLARRATTMYRFYLMTSITLFVYIAALVLLIIGFSAGWTPNSSPGEATATSTVHSINAVAVFIGFLLALVAFIQYYEDVFCGQLQLCRRLGKIFCPCCCPRSVLKTETKIFTQKHDGYQSTVSPRLCMDMYDESSRNNRKRGKNMALDRYKRRTASQLV